MPFKIGNDEYSYDVGPADQQGGPLPADPAPTSDIEKDPAPVDTAGWDLSKQTKLTLAQYLSDTTTGKVGSSPRPNIEPIDYETSYPDETKTTGQDGYPAPLSDGVNSKRFAPNRQQDGLDTNSPAFPTLKSQGFVPGRPGPLSGDTLLRDWPSGKVDLTQQGRPAYVSKVLSTNRFSPDKRVDHSALTYYDSSPDQDGNIPSGVQPATVTVGQLATIGTTLSLRSTIEAKAFEPGANPLSTTAEALALLPGTNQLMFDRVATELLRAKSVLSTLTTEGVQDTQMISTSPGGSWGQLNDVYDPWNGLSNVGMVALSAGLTTVLLLSLTGFYAVFGGLIDKGNGGNAAAAKDAIGRYTLGSYLSVPGRNTLAKKVFNLEMIGIKPTRHPIARCTQVGAGAFFGVGDVTNLTSAGVTSAFLDTYKSPGFNIIVARAIIRSGQVIAERVAEVTKGNPLAVTKGIFELVDLIKSSKIIGAINVFAQLGDTILNDQDDNPIIGLTTEQIGLGTDDIKRLQASEGGAQPSVTSKSRLDGSLKLAWSSNRAPALYLVPESLQPDMLNGNVPGMQDTTTFGPGITDVQSRTTVLTLTSDTEKKIGSRLDRDSDEVKKFEQQLEAEYVPFYFHDLRTNEIISFHAFLESLTDDYNAEWNNNEGFGRVEPVKTYKGTTRRISLGFTVVSTSREDFDEMWVKINKLVTLVYPQYTQGKTITSDGGSNPAYSFTQPFSQLMGASPLIRMRVGDVIRSNFSKFALMRLFGYGDKITLNSTKIKAMNVVDTSALRDKLINAASTAASSKRGDYTFYVQPGTYPLVQGKWQSTAQKLSGGVNNASVFNAMTLTSGQSFVVTVKEQRPDGLLCTVKQGDPLTDNVNKYDIDTHGSSASPSARYEDGVYKIPITALKPTVKTYRLILNELSPGLNPTADDAQVTALKDFFSDTDNAVFRSFKDTGGKGLAGAIETINFDWLDRTVWETDVGARAPMMCRVTMTFSPIHDISPGIDHHGFNRAPVYPVGKFAGSR